MSSFEAAIPHLLAHEGGYVDDPQDPGKETKYGISKRSYPDLDIAALTVEDAKAIYRRDYWDVLRLSEIADQRVAAYVFDMAVNMGHGRAVRILQVALNANGSTLERDGQLGPATLAAANAAHPDRVLKAMIAERGHYYVELTQMEPGRYKRFFGGWILRAFAPLEEVA